VNVTLMPEPWKSSAGRLYVGTVFTSAPLLSRISVTRFCTSSAICAGGNVLRIDQRCQLFVVVAPGRLADAIARDVEPREPLEHLAVARDLRASSSRCRATTGPSSALSSTSTNASTAPQREPAIVRVRLPIIFAAPT
jgi:hypothetical protein